MTDDELIQFLCTAPVGSLLPDGFSYELALAALAKRIVKLEERLTDVLYTNDLWDGS